MMIFLDDESETKPRGFLLVERDESFFQYTIHAFLSSHHNHSLVHRLLINIAFSRIMPPPYDDYSDSDESVEDIQTNVLLGLPDGPISSASDLAKPRISRIGGHPVYKFLNLYSLSANF